MSLSPSQQGLKSTNSVDELDKSDATEDLADTTILSWLKSLGLMQYEHLFTLSGYDDTQFLVSHFYFYHKPITIKLIKDKNFQKWNTIKHRHIRKLPLVNYYFLILYFRIKNRNF